MNAVGRCWALNNNEKTTITTPSLSTINRLIEDIRPAAYCCLPTDTGEHIYDNSTNSRISHGIKGTILVHENTIVGHKNQSN